MLEVTRPLVRYLVQSRYEDLPERVRHEGVRAFHNSLGCMLGGCQETLIERALATLEEFSGPPQATVIGLGRRVDAPTAAMLNTMSNFVHSYNDTHLATVAHPAGAPTAGLLALAETRQASGQEVVHALVLGIEVACRMANVIAAPPAQCHVGLSTHGVTNVIGTAVAAAKLMGLSEDQMVWAIGLAVTQAAGIRSSQGSMGSKIIGGQAARSGLMSAYLAAKGFTNSEQPIEGPKGYAAVLANPSNPAAAIDRLGSHFEILNLSYKPYPSGIVNHPGADACIRLANDNQLDPATVESVHLRVHPLTVHLCNRQQPKDRDECLVSAQHWAAVALLYRRAGLREATEQCATDPAVAALRARITLEADDNMPAEATTVTVTLKDGRTLRHHLAQCIGSLGRPMTDANLDEKFRGQASMVLPPDQVEALRLQCWDIAKAPDVGALVRRFFLPGAA